MHDSTLGGRAARTPSWTVCVVPVPYPGCDAPASYLDAWRRYVDPELTVTADADREDWLEQAARLEAGVRLLGDGTIVRVYGNRPMRTDGTSVSEDMLAGLPHFGCIMRTPTGDYMTDPSGGNRYCRSMTVRGLMRRRTRLVPVDATAVRTAVRELDADSPLGVTVKYVRREKTLPLVHVPHGGGFDAARWLDWEEVRFDGDTDGVLVQETVRMEYEYRMFIVNGEPVCGAGCVEENTPVDNHATFDSMMQRTRNASPVETRADIAERYRRFAFHAARIIHEEGIITPAYVMDVAMIDGQPGIVELNGSANAGLYALDMTALVTAMRDHPEQYVPTPFLLDTALLEG